MVDTIEIALEFTGPRGGLHAIGTEGKSWKRVAIQNPGQHAVQRTGHICKEGR